MFELVHCFGRPRGLPKGVKIGPPRPLGGVLEPLEVWEASWSALGCPLESLGYLLGRSWSRSGPKKTNLERLLAAPRGIPREVSAILGANKLPKGRPRGSKIEVRKRSKLKMAKPLKSPTVHRISLIFEVSSSKRDFLKMYSFLFHFNDV